MWIEIQCDSEEDARKLRHELERTHTVDRMGDRIHTNAPRARVVDAIDRLGLIALIKSS